MAVASVLAVGALAASASPAAAVTLGNPDMGYGTADFGAGCQPPGPTCVWVQTHLPGAKVRAPFSGVIKKWRMAQPGPYEGQLVVMRKRKHGKFEAIRATDPETPPSYGSYTFKTHLKIKKGDYIGIHSQQLMGRDNASAEWMEFASPLELGAPKKPDFKHEFGEYLYNATLRHH
jgi:hypothetical protein